VLAAWAPAPLAARAAIRRLTLDKARHGRL